MLNIFPYLVCKMYNDEGDVGHAGFLKVSTAGVLFVQLLSPVLVRSLWHLSSKEGGTVLLFI